MRTLICTLFLFTSSLSGNLFADTKDKPFPGIQVLMSTEEYKAAGIDKLSAQERKALDQWLIRYTVKDAAVMRRDNAEVKEMEKTLQIVASIKQPFSGWSGKTIFYLDNGQVWRQRLDGRYAYHGENTEIIIQKNFFGYYKMTLTATNRAVGVTRIK